MLSHMASYGAMPPPPPPPPPPSLPLVVNSSSNSLLVSSSTSISCHEDGSPVPNTMVNGIVFRKSVLALMIDDAAAKKQQHQQHQQQQQQVSGLPQSSSSQFVDHVRREPELCHPNWAQDEMMRIAADPQLWSVGTLLPPTVWAPPPRKVLTAAAAAAKAASTAPPPVVIGGVAIRPPSSVILGLPGASAVAALPSLCPFGLTLQDTIALQHRIG